ncbi:MAG: hypothetical protein KJZ87_09550 [Thermoguttaceae bacterium]|nr:hypothetical protein [Thermoguttaceae bacterium]
MPAFGACRIDDPQPQLSITGAEGEALVLDDDGAAIGAAGAAVAEIAAAVAPAAARGRSTAAGPRVKDVRELLPDWFFTGWAANGLPLLVFH